MLIRRHLDPGHAIAGGLHGNVEHQSGGDSLTRGIGIDKQILKLQAALDADDGCETQDPALSVRRYTRPPSRYAVPAPLQRGR